MPGRRDDDNRRGRPERSGRPERGRSGGKPNGGRPAKGRSQGRSGQGRTQEPRGDRRSDDRRSGDARRETGGARPPIKGRRRTFDTDSAPNERERERLARSEGETGETPSEKWVDEGPVRRAAGDAVRRGRSKSGSPSSGERSERNDRRRAQRAAKRAEGALDIDRPRLTKALGPARAARTIQRLGEASDAFAQDRFEDARKLLKPLAETVPDESAIRELYGLTLYRLGRWKLAAAELGEFARRTGSTEQHPVLADCYRALGQHARVEELWDELGAASPEAALVAEGRIVYAGSLADKGRVGEAIKILEAGSLGSPKNLKFHHLRMRYVLADLYDRAGEQQSARRQFEAVANTDPDFFDVRDRLQQI